MKAVNTVLPPLLILVFAVIGTHAARPAITAPLHDSLDFPIVKFGTVKEALEYSRVHTFLVKAIQVTGLDATLYNPNFIGTIAAPTDSAIAKFVVDLALTEGQLLDDAELLKQVLQHHVIPDIALNVADLKDGSTESTLLQHERVAISKTSFFGLISRTYLTGSSPKSRSALVMLPDVKAARSVIHVVGDVVRPNIPLADDALPHREKSHDQGREDLQQDQQDEDPEQDQQDEDPEQDQQDEDPEQDQQDEDPEQDQQDDNAALVPRVGLPPFVPDIKFDSVQKALEFGPFFGTLRKALEVTGLDRTLYDPEMVATIIAPTDLAFKVLLQDLDMTEDELLEDRPCLLRKILKYHVVPGAALTTDAMQDGDRLKTLLRHQKLSVAKRNYFGVIDKVDLEGASPDSRTAIVMVPDVHADRSVVHVVSEVLLPDLRQLEDDGEQDQHAAVQLLSLKFDSVQEALEFGPFFSTVRKAINATGLDRTLYDPELVATIVIPTDLAFRTLLQDLGMKEDELLHNERLLRQVLKYHVVPSAALKVSQLNDGQQLQTLLRDQTFSVDKKTYFVVDKITFTGTSPRSRPALVMVPDVEAGKSIVHVVSEVLLPNTGVVATNAEDGTPAATLY